MNGDLPKGMEIPQVPEQKQPVPVTLARGNYVAAIYQALEILPVVVRVEECEIIERTGRPPEVKLSLLIFDEKVKE